MRTLLIAIVLVIPRLAGEEPKKAEPPDRKGYSEARKISDPGQKIDALRKFRADYPKSPLANSANDLILETLAKSFPERTGEIRNHVDLMVKNVKKAGRAARYQDVADTLADNGVALSQAEELARKALDQFTEKKFIEEQRKNYRKSKEKTPDEAKLKQDYRSQRARFVATLGKTYVKEGKLAAKAGKEDAAFDYLVQARLTCVEAGRSERPGESVPEEERRSAGRT